MEQPQQCVKQKTALSSLIKRAFTSEIFVETMEQAEMRKFVDECLIRCSLM